MLDMLSEAGILGCRATDALIEANIKLLPDQNEILDDLNRYQRLVGKLNYVIVTRPGICICCESISLSTNDHSLRCNSKNS